MLRVHVLDSLYQSAEFFQFFGYVADMFAKIELRVQMNGKVIAVRLSGELILSIFNAGGWPIPKEVVSHFEELMDNSLQANQFVISFISVCIVTVLFFGLEQKSIVCKFFRFYFSLNKQRQVLDIN